MKKARRTVCFVFGLVFALASCQASAWAEGEGDSAKAAPTVVAPGSPGPVDVDQLAGRMKTNQDLYKQIRDQALATYAKLHPVASTSDEEARTAIRLGTYLFIWGDFYREGLWDAVTYHVMAVTRAGISDPLLQALPMIHAVESKRFTTAHEAPHLDEAANRLAGTDYPACFKFWYCSVDAQNLMALKTENPFKASQVHSMLPSILEKAANNYEELIKAHVDPDLLVNIGESFLHGLQGDEESLNLAADTIDKAFAKDDPSNVARDAMQGRYYITLAWTARGTAFADKVTPEGWKLFGERLGKANIILEEAYIKHPDEGFIARQMLTVELGQGQGRDRMESWFGRAIKANPDDFQAYTLKAYYLLPKWYGSDDALWNFSVESAKTQNWSAKIPMVLVDSMVSYLWKKDPGILTDKEKWPLIEATLQGYLAQYPQSNYYRSIFARWATEGGHWKVAQEQFKALGDHWDPMVFPGTRYSEMKGLSDKNPQ